MTRLRVVTAGPCTTVQDLGRFGHLRLGVPAAGMLDPWLGRLANRLAGNDDAAPLLEWTWHGDELEVLDGPVRLAITGDAPVWVDGRPRPSHRALTLAPGQRLRIGQAESGLRGYVAVAGGLEVPRVLGSAATHLRSGLGGWQGRKLAAGDVLPVAAGGRLDLPELQGIFPRDTGPLRVLPGPRHDLFEPSAWSLLLAADWRVGLEADRMALRLEGPALRHRGTADLVSEGAVPGVLQVPGDGRPTVLLADGQPTGGFATLATVITADLGRLAQLRPGQGVRFQAVTPAEALQARRLERERWNALRLLPVPDPEPAWLLARDLIGSTDLQGD